MDRFVIWKKKKKSHFPLKVSKGVQKKKVKNEPRPTPEGATRSDVGVKFGHFFVTLSSEYGRGYNDIKSNTTIGRQGTNL